MEIFEVAASITIFLDMKAIKFLQAVVEWDA